MLKSQLDITDPAIAQAIQAEKTRQENSIELIASENFVSTAVLQAQGSVLTNKYAEGFPGKRYYCGCEEVDKVEELAINRLKKLFNCSYANVQPHSGSQANQAVYLALLKPGDVILSMSLDCGGHLTHGAKPNQSGKWFQPVFYGVNKETNLIDYQEIEALAKKHRPKMIIAGFSSYSRELDYQKFKEIADMVGAYLMADIAHIAGLIATGYHPSPFPHAHIVTSTTHKTLRGARGGIILSDNIEIGKLINKAVFPGLQGGPLMHAIAAKAVAFQEALSTNYREYIGQVIKNANILATQLQKYGYDILTGGTSNHIVILDLRKQNITGKTASESLDRAGITSNKNTVPFDDSSPFVTSGIRLGSAACTTRGFGEIEFLEIAKLIAKLLDGLVNKSEMKILEKSVKDEVLRLTAKFPIYQN